MNSNLLVRINAVLNRISRSYSQLSAIFFFFLLIIGHQAFADGVTIQVTDPAAVCAPATVDLTQASITLGSTSGLTFSYYLDAALLIPIPDPTRVGAGIYYIKGLRVSPYAFAATSINVTVSPISVGGTVNPEQTICFGSSSADLTLNGYTGNIVKWQKSSNIGFTSATDIALTTTVLSSTAIGILSSDTYFRAVVESGACSSANSEPVLITVAQLVGTPETPSPSASTICQGSANTIYTTSATNATSYTWTVSGAGNTISGTGTTGTVTWAAGFSGSATVGITANGCNGSTASSSTTVTVTPTVSAPVFTLGATSSRCQGVGSVTYAATSANSTGITYSLDAASLTGGNSIVEGTGAVTYVAGWSGTTIITASAAGCNGPKSANHTVTLTPTVGIPGTPTPSAGTICQGSVNTTYTTSATNATSYNWSVTGTGNTIFGTGATGTVTWAAGFSGTATVSVTANGCNGPSVAASTAVTVTPTVGIPVFTLGGTSTRCQGAGSVTYTATATNSTGITYSLDAASLTGGNSIVAGTGAVTYVAGWRGTTIITASAAGCNGPVSASHLVTITPTVSTPVFTLGATSSRCQGAGSVTYAATSSNSTGITYSLDAASLTGGNSIVAGTGAVTYVAGWSGTTIITASAAGCNGPKSANHTVTLIPTVGIPGTPTPSASTICQGSANTTYTTIASNATSYNWTVSGAGNTISGTGTVGTVTWAVGFSGSATVGITANGCNGSTASSSTTVTVTPTVSAPVFTLGATSSRCQGVGSVTYAATSANSTGITYSLDAASLTGGNSIVEGTGAVTYVAGWSGTTIITASAAGCNGPKSANHTVTLTPTVGIPGTPTPSAGTICQGSVNTTYTTSATNATSYNWSVTGTGNTIFGTGATGTVTWAAGFSGTATVSVTANGCNGPSVAASTAVTVTPTVGTPVFTLGGTSTRCQGAGSVTYTATATNSIGITYSLDAASLTGGNSIVAGTGAVTYVAGWSGTTIITASATGCNGPVSASHTVTITPTVGIPVTPSPSSGTICQGSANTIYTTSATNAVSYNWSVTGTGNTIAGTGVTGTVTWVAGFSGAATVSVTANGCNGPSVAASTAVTVTPTVGTPVFTLGGTSTRCQGAGSVTYTATATNSIGITYSLDAASLTGGNSIVAGTGAVTYVAGWSGTTIITASATGCNGPVSASHTVTITPTVGIPVTPSPSSGTICQGSANTIYTTSATNAVSYNWSVTGTGNTIAGTGVTGTVTWVAGFSGAATVSITAIGCNGSTASSSTTVTVTPTVSKPVFVLGATSIRCQGAETATYLSTATNSTGITYNLDAASMSGGNSINSGTGAVSYVAGWTGTSIITASAAGCNGPVISTHSVTITQPTGTPGIPTPSGGTICQGSANTTYTTFASNAVSYNWAVTGAGNTIFGTGAVETVTWAAGFSGMATVNVTAIGCNGPSAPASTTVDVTPTVGKPVFVLGATSIRCQGAETVTYTSTATNSTGITYSLDAASLAGGNSILPGTGAVVYSAGWTGTSIITASAVGCNGPVISTHSVTITQPVETPGVPTPSDATICQGSANTIYTTFANNAVSYNWTVTGVGNTIFGTGTTGTVTWAAGFSGIAKVSVTANGCNGPSAEVFTTVTVTPTVGPPVFTLGNSSTRCQGAGSIMYTANASNSTGITYSLDAASLTGGNNIAGTGEVTYAAGWNGTTTITASAAGCNDPVTTNHIVTITPTVGIPVTPSTSSGTICQGSANTIYTTSATNATSYIWTVSGAGNTISGTGTTGTVTWAAGFSGSATVGVTANGCNGSTASSSTTVTVTPTVSIPVFSLGVTSTRCHGTGSLTYTATSANSTGISYSLDATSIIGGNTIVASTGLVSYAAGWSGTTIITASAAGCNDPISASHTVILTPTVGIPGIPTPSAGTICQGSVNTTYTTYAINATNYNWSVTGTGNTISGTGTTGTVTWAAGFSGTAIVSVSANGCNGPSLAVSTSVTVTPTVSVPEFSLGTTSTRCQGAGSVTYTATAINATGLTYSLDAASLTGGNAIDAVSGQVTYVAGWSGASIITVNAAGCNGPAIAAHNVTVTSTPLATISYQGPVCNADLASLYVVLTGSTGGIFSAPEGLKIDPSNGSITPGLSVPGTYTVLYSIAASGGCSAYSNSAQVQILGIPVLESVVVKNVTCTGSADGSLAAKAAGTGTFIYEWTGPSSYANTGSGINGLAAGIYTLKITNTDGCFLLTNDTIRESAIPLSLTLVGANPSNSNALDGNIDVNTMGGTQPSNYLWTGPDSFSSTSQNLVGLKYGTYNVQVTDKNGCVKSGVQILIDPPTAVDDTISTIEDIPITFNIISNDTDNDGTIVPSTIDLDPSSPNQQTTVEVPNKGAFTISVTGEVTFTPVAHFVGLITIQYVVMDNKDVLSNPGKITVTVKSNNRAPLAVDDNYTVAEHNTATGNVFANDLDQEGEPLTLGSFTIGSNSYLPGETATIGDVGTIVIIPDGTFTFIPFQHYNGSIPQINYKSVDNEGLSASANLNITVSPVNDSPIAVDDNITTIENEKVEGNILNNDFDIEGDAIILNTLPIVAPVHGKLVLSANGDFIYQPIMDFIGNDKFTYQICDNVTPSLCSIATVTIVVTKNDSCEIFVPNVFTPNADGVHDYLMIRCLYLYDNPELQIFNRNGNLIFKKDHYGNLDFWGSEDEAFWNGRSENKWNLMNDVLPVGTYYYILKLGDGKVLTGFIFLGK